MQTFAEMISDVGNRVQNTSTAAATIMKVFMNDQYKRIWTKYPWRDIFVWDEAVSVSAGATEVSLPKDIETLLCVSNRTNDYVVHILPGTQLIRGELPTIVNTGTIQRCALAGRSGVKAQPTGSSVITGVSDSGSDTTQTVRVWGLSSPAPGADEERRQDTITLAGTTPAATSVAFSSVERVSLDTDTAGVITITCNVGAVTMTRLRPGERTTNYLKIRPHYVPDADATLYISYKRKFVKLVNDEDVPEIDVDTALMLYTEADWWSRMRQFSKAQAVKADASQALAEIVTERDVMSDQIVPPQPYIGKLNIDTGITY